MQRVIASIEARMRSSRLPGKVLSDVCGESALTRLLNRLKRVKLLDGIVLATTDHPRDDALEEWARSHALQCFRGSENDVLSRVVKTHRMMKTDIITAVTGDCVLIDPEIIDLGIKTFIENDCDLVQTGIKRSYPIGMDVIVYRLKDLEKVESEQKSSVYREHVAQYLVEHPEQYRTINLFAPARLHGPHYRFVLDYKEDLEFINAVYKKLGSKYGDNFGLEEIMALIKKEPSLLNINKHCVLSTPR